MEWKPGLKEAVESNMDLPEISAPVPEVVQAQPEQLSAEALGKQRMEQVFGGFRKFATSLKEGAGKVFDRGVGLTARAIGGTELGVKAGANIATETYKNTVSTVDGMLTMGRNVGGALIDAGVEHLTKDAKARSEVLQLGRSAKEQLLTDYKSRSETLQIGRDVIRTGKDAWNYLGDVKKQVENRVIEMAKTGKNKAEQVSETLGLVKDISVALATEGAHDGKELLTNYYDKARATKDRYMTRMQELVATRRLEAAKKATEEAAAQFEAAQAREAALQATLQRLRPATA